MDSDVKSANSPFRSLPTTVDLVHLRYALAAADHGSFRRAADALLLRQSTLSRCIRQLEERIELIVFERSSGGVRATRAGRDFLHMARSILEQMDTLVASAHRAGRGEAGRLAIGHYTSLSAGSLRATLMDYAQRFPHIETGIVERSRASLTIALRNGAIDIAIVTGTTPLPDSKTMPLWNERIVVALTEGHRLADRETIYWTDLKGETLLVSRQDPGTEIQELLLTKLTSSGDRPKVVCHDASWGSIKNLVGAGFGISLVTESAVGANFSGPLYRELRDGTGPSLVSYSAHWRSDNDNPLLAGFLKLLGERYPWSVV
jgi:DNA-binding transcriptional LysR family regulator